MARISSRSLVKGTARNDIQFRNIIHLTVYLVTAHVAARRRAERPNYLYAISCLARDLWWSLKTREIAMNAEILILACKPHAPTQCIRPFETTALRKPPTSGVLLYYISTLGQERTIYWTLWHHLSHIVLAQERRFKVLGYQGPR